MQKLVKSRRSPQAHFLKLADDALTQAKYAKAIHLARKAQKHELFADYAFWIVASSFRQEAQQQLQQKSPKHALKLAHQALTTLELAGRKYPYSSLLGRFAQDLAQIEILLGEAYFHLHQWNSAAESFERGFQQLQLQNKLDELQLESLTHYLASCEKHPGFLCQSWFVKLTTQFKKKSKEMQAILEYAPPIYVPPGPVFAPGKSQTYKSPDADQLAFDTVFKTYLNEEITQAIQGFEKFLTDFPKSAHKQRVEYWLAQSYVRKNDVEKSKDILVKLQTTSPLTYYGWLASLSTQKPLAAQFNADFPLGVDSDLALTPADTVHLKRAENFLAEKSTRFAILELKEIKVKETFSSPFLFYLASLNSLATNHLGVFQALGELIQRRHESVSSSYCLRLIFPSAFSDSIQRYASEQGLDPILMFSLIKQESAFNEEAHSSAGALGLMQLMPATANDTDPTTASPELLKSENNIRVGTLYFKKLLTRFNGNIALAVAGYNAGPNAVQRWLKENPKRGMTEFIEMIPYRETREYVASIIRNYYWYSLQINGTFEKSLDYFWYPNGN